MLTYRLRNRGPQSLAQPVVAAASMNVVDLLDRFLRVAPHSKVPLMVNHLAADVAGDGDEAPVVHEVSSEHLYLRRGKASAG